ncbi:hypothetical protein OZ411_37310 [Bradyrhizobium sp. Arg237L]|uniref:hypothetical protein n=1 Tax=Bradyrhizobium sp. Arg237L TaxID=3003352 RepID=UPI00249F28FD|nr:hypothetical protein [Bradyrhizobium sp. Arg237L]MDI4238467.1 hypothetical protein [Bradyrhizobium sp. Arg237L]
MAAFPTRVKILRSERARGCERVFVADWLDWAEWKTDTFITRDGQRIRLVLLNAVAPGRGALTRLVDGILASGLQPVVVEPNAPLELWCLKRGWRGRWIGRGKDRHRVFCPITKGPSP